LIVLSALPLTKVLLSRVIADDVDAECIELTFVVSPKRFGCLAPQPKDRQEKSLVVAIALGGALPIALGGASPIAFGAGEELQRMEI
jgi:hypothetical protein